MKRLPITSLLVLLAAPLAGQTLYFKSGRTVEMTPSIRITKDSVRMPLEIKGGGTGEVSLPVSDLKGVDWPRPRELDAASADIKAGRYKEALAQLDAILPVQQALSEVPGSWWGRIALLRAVALANLEREVDVAVEIELLRRSPADAPLVPSAQISVASIFAKTGKIAKARTLLDEVDRTGLAESDLADLCLIEARLLRARGLHEEALLQCLRVPVLHPLIADRQPAALFLAAECYQSLDEPLRRLAALRSIVERFPDSPEAAEAKAILSPDS